MYRYHCMKLPYIFYVYFKPILDIHDHNLKSCTGLYSWILSGILLSFFPFQEEMEDLTNQNPSLYFLIEA